MSTVEWSPAQQDHRQRFKAAIAYVKAVMADPDVRTVYEKQAAEKNKRPFQMAVSELLQGDRSALGEIFFLACITHIGTLNAGWTIQSFTRLSSLRPCYGDQL